MQLVLTTGLEILKASQYLLAYFLGAPNDLSSLSKMLILLLKGSGVGEAWDLNTESQKG